MKSSAELSVSEKLLIAAYDLEARGHTPFSAEDLVVSAWQRFPDTFGLAGYRSPDGHLSHPDSNRVFAEIMGSKPIRSRGFLKKVGTKMYQLTESGNEHACWCAGRASTSSTEKAGLPRDVEKELKRLLSSKAVEKFRKNRPDDVTFYDACAFWTVSPRSTAIEYNGEIANFLKIIEASRKAALEKNVTFEHRGVAYGITDLEFLLEVHRRLQNKFRAEIDVIVKRTDERV